MHKLRFGFHLLVEFGTKKLWFSKSIWSSSYLYPWTFPCRKRQRFETYEDSKTVDHLVDMIGKGQISVSGAIALSGSMVADGIPHKAVQAFSTLRTNNDFPMNGERDLHRWIKRLFGFRLRPYSIQVPLQDPWFETNMLSVLISWLCFKCLIFEPRHF